jgi:hypothetical protein
MLRTLQIVRSVFPNGTVTSPAEIGLGRPAYPSPVNAIIGQCRFVRADLQEETMTFLFGDGDVTKNLQLLVYGSVKSGMCRRKLAGPSATTFAIFETLIPIDVVDCDKRFYGFARPAA